VQTRWPCFAILQLAYEVAWIVEFCCAGDAATAQASLLQLARHEAAHRFDRGGFVQGGAASAPGAARSYRQIGDLDLPYITW